VKKITLGLSFSAFGNDMLADQFYMLLIQKSEMPPKLKTKRKGKESRNA
jgi:hypothetical protein